MKLLDFLEQVSLRRFPTYFFEGSDPLQLHLLETGLKEDMKKANPKVFTRRLSMGNREEAEEILSLSRGRMLMAKDTLFVLSDCQKLDNQSKDSLYQSLLNPMEPRFRFLLQSSQALPQSLPEERILKEGRWELKQRGSGLELASAVLYLMKLKGASEDRNLARRIAETVQEDPIEAVCMLEAALLIREEPEALARLLPAQENADLFGLLDELFKGNPARTFQAAKNMLLKQDFSSFLYGIMAEVRLLLILSHLIPKEEKTIWLRQARDASSGYQNQKKREKTQALRDKLLALAPARLKQDLARRLRNDFRFRKLILTLSLIPEEELRRTLELCLKEVYLTRRGKTQPKMVPDWLLGIAQRQSQRLSGQNSRASTR